MAQYIWQRHEWPSFTWDSEEIMPLLGQVRLLQGRLLSRVSMLGFDIQNDVLVDTLVAGVTKSSEIEGVVLNKDQVRSSVAKHLGIEIAGLPEADRYVDGVVQIMLDATKNYLQDLTKERLFGWHAALFPSGYNAISKITVANWRKGKEPMRVVSGVLGREKIHYEAPASSKVAHEMNVFLEWANSSQHIDSVVKAAVAHIWFVSIHPFEDGNGRLARTITDMFLARADESPLRFYSMSAEMRKRRNEYYSILEQTTTDNLDITKWIIWFLDCFQSAILDTEEKISLVMAKSDFWNKNRTVAMNERQNKMVNMLWDGFEGKLNTSKWAKICKCSTDTALRDISDLLEKGILKKSLAGGRSTNYELVI